MFEHVHTHRRIHSNSSEHVCINLLYIADSSSTTHSHRRHSVATMDFLQNHVLNAVSSTQDIFQIITSLFECVKKESDDMISNIKDLREETYDLTSDLREDITTLQKKVDALNIEFDNHNQYEDSDGLVTSGDIIPQGTATENCKDILFNLFYQHLNMNLDENELTVAYRIGENPTDSADNRKIFFKPNRKQLSYKKFQAF